MYFLSLVLTVMVLTIVIITLIITVMVFEMCSGQCIRVCCGFESISVWMIFHNAQPDSGYLALSARILLLCSASYITLLAYCTAKEM